MFNKQLKQTVSILSDIVSDHTATLIMFEQTLNELVYLKKQNQMLKSKFDDLNNKFNILQSRQVILMNKMESIE